MRSEPGLNSGPHAYQPVMLTTRLDGLSLQAWKFRSVYTTLNMTNFMFLIQQDFSILTGVILN